MKIGHDRNWRRFLKHVLGPRVSNIRFLLAAPLAYPPGHFYSPICDPDELRRRYRDPACEPPPEVVAGIDLASAAQRELWRSWQAFLPEARSFARPDPSRRYKGPSPSYGGGDALVYACMLWHLQPRRLIEVGSGSSSAVALDVGDRFLDRRPRMSCIDPHPGLLQSLLLPGDGDYVEIRPVGVQDVPVDYFDELHAGDLLFIDSTHIVKTCSDVVHELFEILPRLRAGVVVHFHDVFYPFEYPRDWAMVRNYSWNELYMLRAFLTSNSDWEILFFNDYFARTARDCVARDAPEMMANPGGGLWLRRR